MDIGPSTTDNTNGTEPLKNTVDSKEIKPEALKEIVPEVSEEIEPVIPEKEEQIDIQEEPLVPVQPPKFIPRLVDAAGNSTPHRKDSNLEPGEWSVAEVAEFLKINECAKLAEAFVEKGVDGQTFLMMGKTEIMNTVNNKMGPCLKVENLLTLLKNRLNPAQARLLASLRKN